MDLAPEKFDAAYWMTVAKLVSKVVVVGMVAIGGADGAAELADRGLANEEQTEATWQARDGQRELIEASLIARAKCDSALEAFARHRDDERDWEHVLSACHTEGEAETPPAEMPPEGL